MTKKSPNLTRAIRRTLALLIPIALGVGLFLFLTNRSKEAPRVERAEVPRQLRVIDTALLPFVPRTEGFGVANAERTWRAVARVGGRVTEVHPDLRAGARVEEGALLVRIDTTDIQISIATARAEVARLAAELVKLGQEEANNTSTLKIEEEILQVLEGELERIKDLVNKDASSRATYEEKQRSLLAQRQAVLGIENSIALLPANRDIAQAQLDGANASLAQAERDLEFCEIRAPFAGSVGSTETEVGQYVAAQEELFDVSFDDTLRIDAAFPQDQVFRLLGESERELIGEMLADPTKGVKMLDELFTVRVTANIGNFERHWPAKVVGVRESLDEQTRALRMTVLVQQGPKIRLVKDGPPLSRGSFCRVEIRTAAREALVIPRSAVQANEVFLLDSENRLRRTPLNIAFTQGEIAIVRTGIQPGSRLVVSNTTLAIEGQLVDPILDDETATELAREAMEGKAP